MPQETRLKVDPAVRRWLRGIGMLGGMATAWKLGKEGMHKRGVKGAKARYGKAKKLPIILLASAFAYLTIDAMATPFNSYEEATIATRVRSTRKTHRSHFPTAANAARPHRAMRHRPASRNHFRSIRAWRRAGSPVPVTPISHYRNGAMKLGPGTAYE